MKRTRTINKYLIRKTILKDSNYENVEFDLCDFYDDLKRVGSIRLDQKAYLFSTHYKLKKTNDLTFDVYQFIGGVFTRNNYINVDTAIETPNKKKEEEVEKITFHFSITNSELKWEKYIYFEKVSGALNLNNIIQAINISTPNDVIYVLEKVLSNSFEKEIQNALRCLSYTEVFVESEDGIYDKNYELNENNRLEVILKASRGKSLSSETILNRFKNLTSSSRTRVRASIVDKSGNPQNIVIDKFQTNIKESFDYDAKHGGIDVVSFYKIINEEFMPKGPIIAVESTNEV